MHEVRFKSLGGLVSVLNSIAVCRRCHRMLQQHELDVIGVDANHQLSFVPHERRRGEANVLNQRSAQ